MSHSPGKRDAAEMRPNDESGRYWSAPPCRVRVDDGSRVTWIDLKRPYALIGSHRCCTLRIRGAHIPDIAYFLCCLRDRVEIWPTAAIAFPRWGAIHSDLQVVVGPCSLTFHLHGDAPGTNEPLPYLANSEIETRLSWPGQDFTKMFRRPVTIIGDDHPSVLRLHGRGMTSCHYAAVVQDQSFWLVDLSAKRMQRSERVRRIQSPGETCHLGDATLEFVSAKPLLPQDSKQADESGIGLGDESSDGDLHSDADIHSHADLHSDHGSSGISAMASEIYSLDPDPSASFISSKPDPNAGAHQHPSTTRPISDDRDSGNSPTKESARHDAGDEDDPALCLSEGKRRRSRSIGEHDFNSLNDLGTSDLEEDSSDVDDVQDEVIRRVDSSKHAGPRPSGTKAEPACSTEDSTEVDESSTEAALSLVDTALGLVDAAVNESDAADVMNSASHNQASTLSSSAQAADSDPPVLDLDVEEVDSHWVDLDQDSEERNPYESSDVALTCHDPPMLVDRSDACETQQDAQRAEVTERPSAHETIEPSTDQRPSKHLEAVSDDDGWIFDELGLTDGLNQTPDVSLSFIGSMETPPAEEASIEIEPPLLDNSPDAPHTGTSQPSEIKDRIFADHLHFEVIPQDPEESAPSLPENIASPDNESLTERVVESESITEEPPVELVEETLAPLRDAADTDSELTNSLDAAIPDEEARSLIDTIENSDPPVNDEMNHFSADAEHSFGVSPVQPAMNLTPRQEAASQLDRLDDPQPLSLGVAAEEHSPTTAIPKTSPFKNTNAVDAEALTSHITSRLSEIGHSRTMWQQMLRWFAITAGIIVPATVVAWVVHRIYSDWY